MEQGKDRSLASALAASMSSSHWQNMANGLQKIFTHLEPWNLQPTRGNHAAEWICLSQPSQHFASSGTATGRVSKVSADNSLNTMQNGAVIRIRDLP